MALILDGTNGLSDVDGSAATPAIRGSDANTGVFFGTDIVGVSTGGTERMRVDASGNVGIGTSSPSDTIGYGRALDIQSNFGAAIYLRDSDTPTTQYSFIAYDGNDNGLKIQNQNSSGFVRFSTAGTERARIDSSGNLLVGTTVTPTGVTGGSGFISQSVGRRTLFLASTSTSSVGVAEFINPNGTVGLIVTNGSSTSFVTSSDYRLKHDIQPMQNALATVAQLKPVTYKWNADDSQSQGFIAHELQEVVPECVTGEKDAVDAEGNPQYQGIDTSFLVATLTAAIQELKGINDAQAQIITALTARVEALEGAQA
jgi:hypothetical protein